MAFNKNTLLWAGYIILIALGITYIFWGADLIPDAIGIIGYIDDAVALLLMFFALAKWRQIITGTKEKAGLGWKGVLVFLPMLALILVYVFWTIDLIPDSVPFVGYVDDVIVIVIGLFVGAKIYKSLKGKK